jgi:hypothetical protein
MDLLMFKKFFQISKNYITFKTRNPSIFFPKIFIIGMGKIHYPCPLYFFQLFLLYLFVGLEFLDFPIEVRFGIVLDFFWILFHVDLAIIFYVCCVIIKESNWVELRLSRKTTLA